MDCAAAQNFLAEGCCSSSTRDAIDVGPSVGTADRLGRVPADRARRLPCDAGERREPSHAVSSFSRKSLPLHVALVIWRCNTSPTPRAVHGQRCLHGLYHGSQWPWLTSPVLSASPAVARARRAFNHLHLLVSSGSANNSVCFCRELLLLWALPRNSRHLTARRIMWAVR